MLPQSELKVKDRLPPGWSCHISKSTGKRYYFNNQTGASVWDIKELPSPPSPPLTPPVVPQVRPTDSSDPEAEDFSIEEIQRLLEKQETLKMELRNRISGGVEDRLPSADLDSVSPSDSLGGLRSGIGSRLRRKVNWFHDQNVEKIERESKMLKLASQPPVVVSSKAEIDLEENKMETEQNRSPVTEQNITASASSEEEEDDDESLYGADPEELEALSRMTGK